MSSFKESASQTAGPYVHIGSTPNYLGIEGIYPDDLGQQMVNEHTVGERITVSGCVYDGLNEPIKDGLVEIWQADANGLFNSPGESRGKADENFTGWGRQPTDLETGFFKFETVKPGRVPMADGRLQAPHINLWIAARGINIGLSTRIYFADEADLNASDPVLQSIGNTARADTLIASCSDEGYVIHIHLQGESETVFFNV